LVARKNGERMATRAAGDDDLKVRLIANVLRIARALFEAAEAAARRGGSFSGSLFVHAAAIRGLRTSTCRSSANACGSLVYSLPEF
ncbi:MAG: hypothetical protein WAL67_10025, partial [Candidatus Cybelea sp.]